MSLTPYISLFPTHPEVEDQGDDGWSLHEVHPVLRQPVEGFQEEQQYEQGHKLGRKIVPKITGAPYKKSSVKIYVFHENNSP